MTKIKNKHIVFFIISTLLVFLILIISISIPGCRLISSDETAKTAGKLEPHDTAGQAEEAPENVTGEKIQASPDKINGKADQESIISGFNKLVEENAGPDELVRYIDSNVELTVPETMTILLEGLEHIQRAYQQIAMEYLFEGDGQQKLREAFRSEDEFTKQNIDKIADENLRKDILKMFESGYRFADTEGSFYPIIDFSYLKKYSKYIDEEYSDYLDISSDESDYPYSRDAGLTLTWDELAGRIINSEKFLIKYTDQTPRTIEVSELFLRYFAAYIYGQDNTPTRDWSTNIVLDEVVQSYKKVIEKNPDSVSAKILKEFLDELENNDFVLSEDILNSLDKYLNSLINAYKLDSPYMISEQLRYLSYPSDLAIYGYIKLTDGVYREKCDEESVSELVITLSEFVTIGDLSGDGINDAAAILIAEPGVGDGSTFYYLHAIYNAGFYIYSIANIFLGDSIKIKNVEIEDGRIYIDMVVQSEEEPDGNPTVEATKVYRLENDSLIEN